MPFTSANAASLGARGGLKKHAKHGRDGASATGRRASAALRMRLGENIVNELGYIPTDLEWRVERALRAHMRAVQANRAVKAIAKPLSACPGCAAKRGETLARNVSSATCDDCMRDQLEAAGLGHLYAQIVAQRTHA